MSKIARSVIISIGLLCILAYWIGLIFFKQEAIHYFFVFKNGDHVFQDKNIRLNTDYISIVKRHDKRYLLKLKEFDLEQLPIGFININDTIDQSKARFGMNNIMVDTDTCIAVFLTNDFFGDYSLLIQRKLTTYAFLTHDVIERDIVLSLCDKALKQ